MGSHGQYFHGIDEAEYQQAEYCPPIDPALFSAIVYDFDLHDESSLKDAKNTLDALKASALEEEGSDFDPSGSGAQNAIFADHDPSQTYTETDASPSNETDISSISNGISSLDFTDRSSEGDASIDIHQDLDSFNNDIKVSLLHDVFPNTSEFTIKHTLRKYNYNWKPALDDLLNQVYFSEANSDGEERVSAKGIDAFSEDNAARRGRKGKRKGKNAKIDLLDDRRSTSLPVSDSDSPLPLVNKWQNAERDVEFIASRSNIASSTVHSAYYSNHASVTDTISSLLKDSIKTKKAITSNDTTVQSNAVELGHDFPTIAPEYLTALIRMTHPSTVPARELAKALTTKRQTGNGNNASLIVTPVYARIDLSDDDSGFEVKKKSRASTTESSPAPIGLATASGLASSYSNARYAALAQAQAAYRRSRSDHLMAGAAGYYAQVGREHATASQKHGSAAADALVNSQSTAHQLDLHGVSVQDALRIARDWTESWWAGLGESRVNGRRGADERARGFNIVTGVGRHSEGGKGKLGPAVSKMLTAEGWRVEHGSGVITVKGKAR